MNEKKEENFTTLAAIERAVLKDAKVICVQKGVRLVDYITEAVRKENKKHVK